MKNSKLKNGIWMLSLLIIGLLIASCAAKVPEEPRKTPSGKVNPSFDTPPVSGSCAMSYPKIGTFNEVVPDKSKGIFTFLSMENARTFNIKDIDIIGDDGSSISLIDNNKISIDKYEKLVQDYIKNIDQFSVVPKDDWIPNEVGIFTDFFNKINIQKGDIITNGPPMGFCDYGFLGIFTPGGKLKYVEIRDSYKDSAWYDGYSYKGETIEVEPGKQLDCGHYTCTVQADFKVNEEQFSLSIGESYNPKSEIIKSITLLYASVGKEGAPILSDGGAGKQVIYVIEFA